jgi:hypothetical protein
MSTLGLPCAAGRSTGDRTSPPRYWSHDHSTAQTRPINLVEAKVDALRELTHLGLTVLVPQGKHQPPLKANDDIDAAAAVIYARNGYCRVCVEHGHRAKTAAILMGQAVMMDSCDLAGGLKEAYCALGGLPATVGLASYCNGCMLTITRLFTIPPRVRLQTQLNLVEGVRLVAEGMVEVAPFRRRDEIDNLHAADLDALPAQIPLLPPRWRKALAAPRLKAGGKWFAFGSVDEATRLAIAAKALRKSHELLAELLPGGSSVCPDYVARNPNRDDHRAGSFRINMVSGAWADFAMSGIKGQDLISLTAYVRGCDYAVAATWLSTRFS